MSGTGSPNTSSTAVRLALAAFAVVSVLALLSYLGLGDPVPAAELGNITHSGLTYLREFPRVAALPIAGVAGLVLMANIAGAAFRRRYIRT